MATHLRGWMLCWLGSHFSDVVFTGSQCGWRWPCLLVYRLLAQRVEVSTQKLIFRLGEGAAREVDCGVGCGRMEVRRPGQHDQLVLPPHVDTVRAASFQSSASSTHQAPRGEEFPTSRNVTERQPIGDGFQRHGNEEVHAGDKGGGVAPSGLRNYECLRGLGEGKKGASSSYDLIGFPTSRPRYNWWIVDFFVKLAYCSENITRVLETTFFKL